jgi:hypothetical protein
MRHFFEDHWNTRPIIVIFKWENFAEILMNEKGFSPKKGNWCLLLTNFRQKRNTIVDENSTSSTMWCTKHLTAVGGPALNLLRCVSFIWSLPHIHPYPYQSPKPYISQMSLDTLYPVLGTHQNSSFILHQIYCLLSSPSINNLEGFITIPQPNILKL